MATSFEEIQASASYIVFVDNGVYYAQNGATGVVTSNATLSTLLTALNTAIGTTGGFISFKNDGYTYTLTASVSLNEGIFLDFNDTLVNVAAVNAICFIFNDNGSTINGMLTGMANAKFYGAVANTGTWAGKIETIERGAVFENIHLINCNNGFELEGACYTGLISHCSSSFDVLHNANLGTFILIEGASMPYVPNNSIVENCEISALDNDGVSSFGVKVTSINAGADAVQGIHIKDSWFESVNTCIYNDGEYTNIHHNHFIPIATAITCGTLGFNTTIEADIFDLYNASSNGVSINYAYSTHLIRNNAFYAVTGYAIDNVAIGLLTIDGNVCKCTNNAAGSFFHSNVTFTSHIRNNQFNGLIGIDVASAQYDNGLISGNQIGAATGIYSPDVWQGVIIEGNMFTGTTGINIARLDGSIITGNAFVGVTTPISAFSWYPGGNKVENNVGVADTVFTPFVNGTTFLSAAGAAWGWEIDATTEYAICFIRRPDKARLITGVKVIGNSVIAEAHGMMLTLTINGAGANEVYNTEVVSVTKISTTLNFAATDFVEWDFVVGDDADLAHILGGDILMFKVEWSDAVGVDIGTDCIFQGIEISYI